MAGAESVSGCELLIFAAASFAVHLERDLRPLVALVRQIHQLRLDLRAEQRAKLLGIDLDLIAIVHPGGQAVPVIPRCP